MHRFLLALALIVTVQPTAAQVAPNSGTTSTGNVTILSVDETSFGVRTNGQMPNPANCTSPDYKSQNQLHYAAALTAFIMITSITITVDPSECTDDHHPKIVSIELKRKGDDVPGRVEAIQDTLFSMSQRLDTLEEHVIDANKQTNQLITQRADQGSAQGNLIASKVDQFEQLFIGFGREFRDPSGRTLINLVGSIAQKVGAP
jgi:hypothetical protein